jgi:hypothetical protein
MDGLIVLNEERKIEKIESFCNFRYFKEFFINLFAIKDKTNKIKKAYFEIKNCFQKLNLNLEAYKTIERCYDIFPNDIIVAYELLKQSITVI